MKCSTVRYYLSEYLDGELNYNTRQAINEHLALCDDCRRELENLRKLRASIQAQINTNNLNIDTVKFAQNLKQRIQFEGLQEHRPVTNFYGRLAVVIFALIIIILLMGIAQYVNYISSFQPIQASLAAQDANNHYDIAQFKYPVSTHYQPLFSYPIKYQTASAWLSEMITGYSQGKFSYDFLYPILEQSNILDGASIVYRFQDFSVTSPRPAPTLLLRHKLPQQFILKFPRNVLLKSWDKLYTGIKSDYRGFTDAPIISHDGLTNLKSDEVYILFFVP